jgi:hypothetical protein
MKISIELTESILNVLTVEQKTEILRGLITSIKSDVNDRISRIKAELSSAEKMGDTIPLPEKVKVVEVPEISQKTPVIKKKPEFSHQNQLIPNSIIAEIQSRYDDGDESLALICEDYPQWAYRSIWAHIKLKKKTKK